MEVPGALWLSNLCVLNKLSEIGSARVDLVYPSYPLDLAGPRRVRVAKKQDISTQPLLLAEVQQLQELLVLRSHYAGLLRQGPFFADRC